jgi:hypothetical protein
MSQANFFHAFFGVILKRDQSPCPDVLPSKRDLTPSSRNSVVDDLIWVATASGNRPVMNSYPICEGGAAHVKNTVSTLYNK